MVRRARRRSRRAATFGGFSGDVIYSYVRDAVAASPFAAGTVFVPNSSVRDSVERSERHAAWKIRLEARYLIRRL